ncbi:MAG TPA: hypothetical protein VMU70_00015 [Candidatus Tyrphobacter sp.]|nr:hypothetical protein [Candidatus Tyrphobacter sp.]
MVLGIKELHRLVEEKKLVEGLSDRELKEPEGAGFDLRIGELYALSGLGFLGITERETPSVEILASHEVDGAKRVILAPKTYYS